MTLKLLPCPHCRSVAEVDWRTKRHGAGAVAELVKIRCVRRHWFLMPADQLDSYPAFEEAA
ncbi:MAG TPA: hypothetical protein VFU35_02195 [Jatrophihabitans sp.]|nr:hypothetical protein [Jatrophihabitans sp.]